MCFEKYWSAINLIFLKKSYFLVICLLVQCLGGIGFLSKSIFLKCPLDICLLINIYESNICQPNPIGRIFVVQMTTRSIFGRYIWSKSLFVKTFWGQMSLVLISLDQIYVAKWLQIKLMLAKWWQDILILACWSSSFDKMVRYPNSHE